MGPREMRMGSGELDSFHLSTNILRLIKSRSSGWVGHVARIEAGRRAIKMLTGRPIGKRPLGKPSSLWEDNIKMNLKEIDNTRN